MRALLVAFAVAGTGAATLGWGVIRSVDAASVDSPLLEPAPAMATPLAETSPSQEDPPYDGHYQFVRVRFDEPRSFSNFGRGFGREPFWAHDWPRADVNFLTILDELTNVSPTPGEGKVLRFDDPEIFRFPVAYLVEVGYWAPSQAEIDALGQYLRKGGFLIVDDFRGPQIRQMQAIIDAALGLRIQEVPVDHPIFDSFFRIEDPYRLAPPTFQQYTPEYLGVFENNDPNGRLLAMLNYNNDIAEYWETSGRGWYLIDLENEAFKFGVNYVVYSMTH